MSSRDKVVKFKKRKNFNIGIAIFLIMLIYVGINVYIYFTKEQLSIYEVQEGSNTEDNLFHGLILRDEEIIYSNAAGYITYFQKEGTRVHKNASVCSIDDSRQIYDIIMSGETPVNLTNENIAEVKYDIKKFQRSFSDDNFTYVYDFKEDAQNTVYELLNNAMINYGQSILEDTGFSSSYQTVKSTKSGVVTYYADSYEAINQNNITKDLFQFNSYQRTNLRTTDMITNNSPIFKLIKSDRWSIVIPLTDSQYQKLIDTNQIRFTILKDDFTTSAKLSLFQSGMDYFAKLDLDKHMANYIEDRFLEIELSIKSATGLKIPVSSIVEKEFYLVPLDYFTTGGENSSTGIVKENYNDIGEVTPIFIPTDIYYEDDTYGYVDARLFSPGTWIQSTTGAPRYQVTQMNTLTGVFNVNLGYAVFKRIEILYSNDEYCIVKRNTKYGLSLYDHIALAGSKAVEQAIIY